MACKTNIFALLGGTPDQNGAWFLTGVGGSYDGSIKISDDDITYYNTTIALNNKVFKSPEVPAGYNIYVDFEGENTSSLIFTYVTPLPLSNVFDPEWCEEAEGECHYECSTVTLNRIIIPADVEVDVACDDATNRNLFTDAGVSSGQYDIISCDDDTPPDNCGLFNLVTGLYNVDTMGIPAATYTFEFEAKNTIGDCSTCIFTLMVIVSGDSGGVNQSKTVCFK